MPSIITTFGTFHIVYLKLVNQNKSMDTMYIVLLLEANQPENEMISDGHLITYPRLANHKKKSNEVEIKKVYNIWLNIVAYILGLLITSVLYVVYTPFLKLASCTPPFNLVKL